jgi:hypothetical protein
VSEVQQLARQIDSDDPEEGLRAVAALRRLLEDLEVAHVEAARQQGRSWEAIARALGVTRQSAHKKHNDRSRHRRT